MFFPDQCTGIPGCSRKNIFGMWLLGFFTLLGQLSSRKMQGQLAMGGVGGMLYSLMWFRGSWTGNQTVPAGSQMQGSLRNHWLHEPTKWNTALETWNRKALKEQRLRRLILSRMTVIWIWDFSKLPDQQVDISKEGSMRIRHVEFESEWPVALWKEKTVPVARFWLVYFCARQAWGKKKKKK